MCKALTWAPSNTYWGWTRMPTGTLMLSWPNQSKHVQPCCAYSFCFPSRGNILLLTTMVCESSGVHISSANLCISIRLNLCLCVSTSCRTNSRSARVLLYLICHGNGHFLITVSGAMVITASLFCPLNTHISVPLPLFALPPCSLLRQPFIKYTRQSFK